MKFDYPMLLACEFRRLRMNTRLPPLLLIMVAATIFGGAYADVERIPELLSASCVAMTVLMIALVSSQSFAGDTDSGEFALMASTPFGRCRYALLKTVSSALALALMISIVHAVIAVSSAAVGNGLSDVPTSLLACLSIMLLLNGMALFGSAVSVNGFMSVFMIPALLGALAGGGYLFAKITGGGNPVVEAVSDFVSVLTGAVSPLGEISSACAAGALAGLFFNALAVISYLRRSFRLAHPLSRRCEARSRTWQPPTVCRTQSR